MGNKKNVTFVTTDDMHEKIKTTAFIEGKEISEIVMEALEAYFKGKGALFDETVSRLISLRQKS